MFIIWIKRSPPPSIRVIKYQQYITIFIFILWRKLLFNYQLVNGNDFCFRKKKKKEKLDKEVARYLEDIEAEAGGSGSQKKSWKEQRTKAEIAFEKRKEKKVVSFVMLFNYQTSVVLKIM